MATKKTAETWYHRYALRQRRYYRKDVTGDTDDYRCGGHLGETALPLSFMKSILVTSIKAESLVCLQHVPLTFLDCTMRNIFSVLYSYFLTKGASYIITTLLGRPFLLGHI